MPTQRRPSMRHVASATLENRRAPSAQWAAAPTPRPGRRGRIPQSPTTCKSRWGFEPVLTPAYPDPPIRSISGVEATLQMRRQG